MTFDLKPLRKKNVAGESKFTRNDQSKFVLDLNRKHLLGIYKRFQRNKFKGKVEKSMSIMYETQGARSLDSISLLGARRSVIRQNMEIFAVSDEFYCI